MPNKYYLIIGICLFIILQCGFSLALAGPIGWASVNGGTTGGEGGETITVTTKDELYNALNLSGPKIINVSGMISFPDETISGTQGDKTIQGVGSGSGWYGCVKINGPNNVILRNLTLKTENRDPLLIQQGATNFWVDHCSFVHGVDELISVKDGADYITISWCKFSFESEGDHNLAALIGSTDNHPVDEGHLNITWHHNWFADRVHGRMPRVRYGKNHVFNNYYAVPNHDGYCVTANWGSQLLVENNYFYQVESPYNTTDDGRLRAVGNILDDCFGSMSPGNDVVFTPPYAYTLENPVVARDRIISCAGAGHLDCIEDDTPPTPDPMTWAIEPNAVDGSSISMTAAIASDLFGAEHYFACTTGSGHDSGWQTSPTYVDTGLQPRTTYGYRVMARDFSTNANETGWSDTASATTTAWSCTAPIDEDLSGDCQVNLVDFSMLAAQWTGTPVVEEPNELIVNGDFTTDLSGWTLLSNSPATITWDSGTALLARNDATLSSDGNLLFQIIPVVSGQQYKIEIQWKGDLLNGGTGQNRAEVIVGFGSSPTVFNGAIIYKKATDGGPNEEPMPWDWESVLLSPSTSLSPVDGIFTATNSYMTICFHLGGNAGVGPGYYYVDNISVVETDVIPCPSIDLNDDCALDLLDIEVFAADWLTCNRDPSNECWQ